MVAPTSIRTCPNCIAFWLSCLALLHGVTFGKPPDGYIYGVTHGEDVDPDLDDDDSPQSWSTRSLGPPRLSRVRHVVILGQHNSGTHLLSQYIRNHFDVALLHAVQLVLPSTRMRAHVFATPNVDRSQCHICPLLMNAMRRHYSFVELVGGWGDQPGNCLLSLVRAYVRSGWLMKSQCHHG